MLRGICISTFSIPCSRRKRESGWLERQFCPPRRPKHRVPVSRAASGILAAHMRCEEKDRLIGLYTAAVARYSATVNDTTVTRGKTSKQEYDRLLSLSEEARTVGTRTNTAAKARHYCFKPVWSITVPMGQLGWADSTSGASRTGAGATSAGVRGARSS